MSKFLIALNVVGVILTAYLGWSISSLLYAAGASMYGLFVALATIWVVLDVVRELIIRLRSFMREDAK